MSGGGGGGGGGGEEGVRGGWIRGVYLEQQEQSGELKDEAGYGSLHAQLIGERPVAQM